MIWPSCMMGLPLPSPPRFLGALQVAVSGHAGLTLVVTSGAGLGAQAFQLSSPPAGYEPALDAAACLHQLSEALSREAELGIDGGASVNSGLDANSGKTSAPGTTDRAGLKAAEVEAGLYSARGGGAGGKQVGIDALADEAMGESGSGVQDSKGVSALSSVRESHSGRLAKPSESALLDVKPEA